METKNATTLKITDNGSPHTMRIAGVKFGSFIYYENEVWFMTSEYEVAAWCYIVNLRNGEFRKVLFSTQVTVINSVQLIIN